MRKWTLMLLLLLGLTSLPIIALAQSDSPFDITDARLNGLTLPEGTRYVFILPYNSADAVYDLSVTVNLPLGVQLISAQQANGIIFSGVSQNATHTQLFWRADEIFSGDLFAPFAFTLNASVNDVVDVTVTWADSLGEMRSEQIALYPNTLNAIEGGASFNAEAPIPAEQFTFIGDTGVVIYSPQELPAGAITVREAPAEENPPAELGDFWWCSGLDLQGASGVTVYVPLRKPLPPLMPLTLFASVNGAWQALDVQGYVSADGLYAVYDHPGGLIFTGTEGENNPTEVPPAPPPPPDSDGDGFTDDVDACPNAGDAGFGLDGAGCPLPPPDTDGDGIPDPNDTCPTQGDAGFGLDGAGCPLSPPPPPPDSDGDGIPDPNDTCPTQGDAGFGLGGDGCPLAPPPDSDGDGIPDFSDTCPTEGDLGLGLNGDGCPILPLPDTDGDGIPDPNDACPEQGDGGFGITADGCPLLPTFTPTTETQVATPEPTFTETATTAPLPTPSPVTLVRFNFTQFTTVFGTTAQAQVEIAEPFPADVRVLINPLAGANNVPFNAPSEVIIPSGQTSATFGVTAEVNTSGFINLVASLADNPNGSIVANILVQPLALTGITVADARLLPNQTTRATLSMSNPAEFDISIALTSTTSDVFVAPIVMPAGATSTTFDVTASSIFSSGQAQISATFGDTAIFGAQSVTSAPIQLASALNYQVVLPETISTPGDYTGEIVLIDPILSIPTTFTLASSRADVIISAQVTLPAGTDRTTFTISIADSAVVEDVTISATESITGASASGIFRLHTLRIQSVAFAEPNLTAGLSSVVRVTLNAPVPSGVAELTINLNNSDVIPNLTPIDAEAGLYILQIAQGEATAQFDVTVAPTLADDASVTLTAIFPANISANTTAQALSGVRIVSLNFGSNPIAPGSIIQGQVILNVPASTSTVIRLAPADSNTFFFNLPQNVFINAGETTGSFSMFTPLSTPTSRVGVIAHFDTQTPADGVTGFFTIATVQLAGVEVSSDVLSDNAPITVTVRLTAPVQQATTIIMRVRQPNGINADFVRFSSQTVPAGASELVSQLSFVPSQFSGGLVNDTLNMSLIVTIATAVTDSGAFELSAPIQIRPLLIPDSITATQNGSILSTIDTAVQLNVRLRGANTATGGTIQISTNQPNIIAPVESVIQVPAGVTTIPISLKILDGNLQNSSQRVTVTVTDVNGQNPKQTEITLVAPSVSMSISTFTSNIASTLIANVTSNANFSLNCGDPCYFNIGTIPQRTRPLGQSETLTVSLGGGFFYAAFDSSEQLTGSIIARAGNAERTVTRTFSPSTTINANLSARPFTGNQSQIMLEGTANLSNSLVSSVRFSLESSLPSVIPPVFFSSDFITCNITGAGSSTRTIFSSGFSPSVTTWCMDVREDAVTAPTPVTITLVATSTSGNMTYTSRKSFTIVVEPSGIFGTPTPTRTPITLINVATPLPALQLGQNVTVNIATATPAPTRTPAPTLAPVLVQSQFSFSPNIVIIPTPAPITLSLSVNTSTRRGTVSISNTLNTDLVINISSSNSRVVGVPATIIIPRGSRSASFNYTLNTSSLRTLSTTIRISVSGGGDSTSSSFTVRR